jgi:hypothetical protein
LNAFNESNQTSGSDWIHFTLASGNSDSDFAPDLSAARLHIGLVGEVFLTTLSASKNNKENTTSRNDGCDQ